MSSEFSEQNIKIGGVSGHQASGRYKAEMETEELGIGKTGKSQN